jgi:hypothetical protein
MLGWQQTITTDQHSISIRPDYIDTVTSLQLSDYCPFFTTLMTEAGDDITGALRTSITSLGCYHGITPQNINAAFMGYKTKCTKTVFYFCLFFACFEQVMWIWRE